MCGVCGVYEYASSMRVDGQRLARMNATIVHRGPDDDGFFVRERVGLAMRRLRIIDLAGGKQPITNEDETVTIVFNGEIYNYRELRRELVARGHHFRTQSDTEVVVHAYEEFGTSCVERLDGMFAFAIYDERVAGADRLFLARDPFGKKPLYYADLGQTLIFGSEIKPILEIRASRGTSTSRRCTITCRCWSFPRLEHFSVDSQVARRPLDARRSGRVADRALLELRTARDTNACPKPTPSTKSAACCFGPSRNGSWPTCRWARF